MPVGVEQLPDGGGGQGRARGGDDPQAGVVAQPSPSIRLRNGTRSGALVRTLTSPDLDTPTTLAFDRGRLWVVNARFGTPVTPTTDYWLTSLHR